MTAPFADGDLSGLFEQMQRLQGQLADAQAVSSATEVEGRAGGGVVRVRAAGEFEFSAVEIDPAILADGDVAILEDLVLAAVRDAVSQLVAVRQAAVRDAVGGAIASLLDAGTDDDLDEPGTT